ncbi:LTA synthase family protein [Liquorilactobacillus sicerae]|uniref:LTA synthase family protein n=1 Tax=Liquorilactobacillus sicerae TaxID=1416943 RepID=UPI0024811128|nr:LTA synthase family protein [Liquorilactobacillus sicerae]
MQKIKTKLSTRWGFFELLVFLFWLKTVAVYLIDFRLGVSGLVGYATLLFNPLATTLLLFGAALYIKRTVPAYLTLIIIYLANTALLLFNVIYYREFTDFMTFNVIFGYSSVSEGLSTSSVALLKPQDIVIVADLVLLILGFITKIIRFDPQPIPKKQAIALTSFSIFLIFFNLTIAEAQRPQLLTRTFDRSYLVKYLGLDAFTFYDGVKTAKNSQVRSEASSTDLNQVLAFTRKHYAKPDSSLFGIAKGKNVIVIHLESFEQFLINYKLNGQEVTPFLNSLYHSKSTYSFSNFFNQVGQGKTSDAENMLENSVYGLPQGSLFSALGTDNTFQAAPAILNQRAGYSSAVFHGNKGSFWNRDNVYKNFGYQYFFDSSYFNTSANNLTEYGVKDKLLFHDSIKYLEHLQQPFYVKYITVTNHFPYDLDKKNSTFTAANTDDDSVNNYFVTAHYLDQAIKEFFTYLKKSGLYDNSIIVIYGDHYGISDSRNLKLATLLGKSAATWNDFDNMQMQRVPFMIHIPGLKSGGVQTTYGGEIDVLPTLLHLLGISSKRYIQFGTDLFSKNHDQTVAFRNGNFITPNYSYVDGDIYQNKTGEQITHPSAKLSAKIKKNSQKVNKELSLSDSLNNKNLLRYYVPKGFKPVDPKNYNYKDDFGQVLQIEKMLKQKSTSLWSKNGDHSTISDYTSDAPEIKTTDNNEKNLESAYSSVDQAASSLSSSQAAQSSK